MLKAMFWKCRAMGVGLAIGLVALGSTITALEARALPAHVIAEYGVPPAVPNGALSAWKWSTR